MTVFNLFFPLPVRSYSCHPGVWTAFCFSLLPLLMPFPVRESETCFGNPLKCFKKRFSPMLFSPCYLSEVFLVGYSVELETANLHPR